MVTIYLLQQAAKLILENDQVSVPMIQRSLVIDYKTADALLDNLTQLGVVNDDDVYRTVDVSDETKAKLQVFLTEKLLDERDELFDKAVESVLSMGRASASVIQRMLGIGYARAARLIDQLESECLITPSDGTSKPRKVIVDKAKAFLEESKKGEGKTKSK